MSFWKGIIFTHSQKLGLIGLVSLMILALIGIRISKYLDNTSGEVTVNQALPQLPEESIPFQGNRKRKKKEQLSPLDINLADSSQWVGLRGIGPVLSRRIIRFREARSGFQSVEDLKAVYGLKEEVFAEIRPLLFVDPATIPARQKKEYGQRHTVKSPRPAKLLDINLATAEELQSLHGIGPVLSKRIIKFRTALGGFEDIDQLKKVYGLAPETYETIQANLYVEVQSRDSLLALDTEKEASVTYQRRARPAISDTIPRSEETLGIARGDIAAIDLNEADSMRLVALPGIGAWTASQILGYRNRIGFYSSTDQVKDIPRLTEKNFQRMEPYLLVGDLSSFAKEDLNRANEWKLRVHGPISDSLAHRIITYRRNLGRFASWQELRQIDGLDDSTISYLRIYFKI